MIFSLSGFIDVIVIPAYEVCSEVMEIFLRDNSSSHVTNTHSNHPWTKTLANNRKKWKEQCQVINKGNTIDYSTFEMLGHIAIDQAP